MPCLLSGCWEDAGTRYRRELKYPIDTTLEAVLINNDYEWTVNLWQGEGPALKGLELRPRTQRRETYKIHFDRPFEIRRFKFSAMAHGRVVADQVFQVRPGDQTKIGVVFERTPENVPTIIWLTNPDG